MELPSQYNPKETEDKIYQLWEESGFFNPDNLPKRHKKPFTIAIPPPNVTGSLHMGHALQHTIHDILIRRKRMQGFKALWLPGTDHAGIATQRVVEKELQKQGISKFDLGKEKFVEKVWEWKEKYGDIILNQLKKMGSSCDWSRTRFTMDEQYTKAVQTAFAHYHKKGWIYKGKRIVNWCRKCGTSLSDLELEYKEEQGKLYFIKYPIKGENNFITVATTRPETMLGDTAVAVNPKDARYKNLVGKTVILPLVNREIPIISDVFIDSAFGTGAVKVTPAHDLNDEAIGQRHKLQTIQVIDERGKIINSLEKYNGLKTEEARAKILEDLQAQNLIEKIEDYTHQVPVCYRCGTVIELIPSEQWFLKMQELAKLAQKTVKSGKVKFSPKNFEKPYFDWLANIKDWCISRQIWWGHKIPVEGEDSVLDTWFSSALWPFATLGWPDKTKDFKTFYPTQTLCTARDIINLWVARMIFSGMEFTKKSPFGNVLIHATVLTKDGKRMSKSLGTGIDPMGLIEKYGADATRFGLAYQAMGNQDMRFSEDAILMGKKFANKIWNASRFVITTCHSCESGNPGVRAINSGFRVPASSAKRGEKPGMTEADRKILIQLKKTVKSVNKDLDNFEFGQASHTLYDFFWHDFCDVYIEASKQQNDEKTKSILLYVLTNSLKLLHPFMPFVTEAIYQQLPTKKMGCIMIEEWPSTDIK